MLFQTREEAGELLAEKLEKYNDENVLVLVVPRGGMPVAYPTLEKFGFEYDFIIPRKIGSPLNEEQAIGAVAMDGTYTINEYYVKMIGISPEYILREVAVKIKEIKERMRKYRGNDTIPDVTDKTVIIMDDGIATGFTIMAAIKSLQKQSPKKIVLAIPVGPQRTLDVIKQEIDEVICIHTPEDFGAVGAYFKDFHQVSDEEMFTYMDKVKNNLEKRY